MTKDSVIDIIHKTIYDFFDVAEDDSEEPINEKDKLLLEVNKAICNAIKNMPDDECRWIPVTERLPDKEGKYLVTIKGRHPYIMQGWYEYGRWNLIDVSAWMDMKPYEGSEEE